MAVIVAESSFCLSILTQQDEFGLGLVRDANYIEVFCVADWHPPARIHTQLE